MREKGKDGRSGVECTREMVKASKWFRKLLMMRGGGDPKSSPPSRDARSSHSYSKRKEKEKHSMRWPVGRGRAILHGGNEEEEEEDEEEMVQVQQNRVVNRQGMAMAVAAATVAAADAAVSAAQAAAKLVRLTSINGHFFIIDGGVINREQWAAIRIQSAFRGYLSQRAIRALKGVVKLQALVRGQIVRRQATITLQCMQSLLRVQAKVQAQRNTLLKAHQSETNHYKQGRPLLERSVDNGDVEKRWSWLDDRWIATRTIDNPVFDSDATDHRDDGIKIVQMDTAKVVVVKKRNDSMSEPCSPFSPSNISSSPSSTMASPSSIPTILNNPFMGEEGRTRRNLRVNEDYYSREVFHSNTNNNSTGSNSIISSNIGTPLPNYMTTTHSSKAKVRSLSEPKQRPDSQLTPLRTRHSLMVHNEKEPVKPRPVNSKGGNIHGPFNVDHNYTTSLKERHYSRH